MSSTKKPAHTPEPLKVREANHQRQFWVEGCSIGPGEFDSKYVSFSGYFGGYTPHLFAAAPDLLEALIYLRDCAEFGAQPTGAPWARIQAVIARATGEAA